MGGFGTFEHTIFNFLSHNLCHRLRHNLPSSTKMSFSGISPCVYHQSPWANIASATLLNPAILLPATKLGNSPSFGLTYSFAVSRPFLKQASMMPFSLASTSSEVHDMRCEFCAISSPETATPPALAALPEDRISDWQKQERYERIMLTWCIPNRLALL